MLRPVLALFFLIPSLALAPVSAQRVQTIRLTRSSDGSVFRFDPERVTVKPGDLVEFAVESGGPYVVGFEPAGLDPRSRALLAAVLPEGGGELRGPVLAHPGSRFRMAVPALAPGSYRFVCLTHVSYRMAGTLIVR
jgi:plastocyanin